MGCEEIRREEVPFIACGARVGVLFVCRSLTLWMDARFHCELGIIAEGTFVAFLHTMMAKFRCILSEMNAV